MLVSVYRCFVQTPSSVPRRPCGMGIRLLIAQVGKPEITECYKPKLTQLLRERAGMKPRTGGGVLVVTWLFREDKRSKNKKTKTKPKNL